MFRKTMTVALCIAVIAAFALPASAFARGGAGKRPGAPRHGASSHGKQVESHRAAKSSRREARKSGKAEKSPRKRAKAAKSGKVEKSSAKKSSAKKAAATATLAGAMRIKRHRAPASEEASGVDEPDESVEATKPAWSGDSTPTPFARITANIQKSMAKVANGTKKQIPPGLMRVWLKFAGWLGVTSAPPTRTPDPVTP